MKFTRNRMIATLVLTLGVVTSVVFGTQSHAAVWNGKDCSTNSIIKCGVSSPNDLRAKYRASSELQALYAHFGITSADVARPMRAGTVTKTGNVIVDGKVIATNAMSVGRHQDDGSGCKGTAFSVGNRTYYKGTTACRFGNDPKYSSQAAYILYKADGSYAGAILRPCGNIAPAKPKPQPKPQSITCDALTARAAVSSDMVGASKLAFNFTTKASAKNGAKIKNYTYNFGDGSKTTTGATTGHSYAKTGTYTVTVTVNGTLNGKAVAISSAQCKTTVKPYKATPRPPVVSCTSLELVAVKDTTYNLKASASATPGLANIQKPGSISGYTYTIKDANGTVIKTINKDAGLPSQQSESGEFSLTPGAYTAQVVVHSNAGDKTGTQCTVKFSVPAPHQIQVCRLSDQTLVTINENDFDASKYSKDFADCEKVTVCDTTTNTVVTVTKNQAKESKYTTDMSKCQPAPPTQPTPPELPHTGASNVVMSLVGAGSLIAALSYYVASRRAL